MSPGAVLRELKSLDELEKRCRQMVHPSVVLLREIDKRREALLNPVDSAVKPEVRK